MNQEINHGFNHVVSHTINNVRILCHINLNIRLLTKHRHFISMLLLTSNIRQEDRILT